MYAILISCTGREGGGGQLLQLRVARVIISSNNSLVDVYIRYMAYMDTSSHVVEKCSRFPGILEIEIPPFPSSSSITIIINVTRVPFAGEL